MLAEGRNIVFTREAGPGETRRPGQGKYQHQLDFQSQRCRKQRRKFPLLRTQQPEPARAGGMPLTSPFLLNALQSEDTGGEIAMPRWDVEGSEFWGPVA